MKKSLSIFLIIGLVLISCEKESPAPNTPTTQDEDPFNGGDNDGTPNTDSGATNLQNNTENPFVHGLNTPIPIDSVAKVEYVKIQYWEEVELINISKDTLISVTSREGIDVLALNNIALRYIDFTKFFDTDNTYGGGGGYGINEGGYMIKIHFITETPIDEIVKYSNIIKNNPNYTNYGAAFASQTIFDGYYDVLLVDDNKVITLYGTY